MTINEYQRLAQRTASTRTKSEKIENGILGLCGETGEIADVYKKYLYQGHEFDREHMAEELGDVCWYVAELATGLGVTLEEVMRRNIEKLRKRYPDGFDAERSMHREVEAMPMTHDLDNSDLIRRKDVLWITKETGASEYKKNYVYLNAYTMYVVEDITGTHADPYHYVLQFHTNWLPEVEVR